MQPSSQVRRSKEDRARVLQGVVVVGFGLVALGLARLQVAEHDQYLELSKENHVRLEVLRAPRGAIYDRNGQLLADSAPSFNVVYRPFPAESLQLRRLVRSDDWTRRVARVLKADTAEVRRLVSGASA